MAITSTLAAMAKSVLYMSMSLDGYIAGSNDTVGNSGGDGFMRLHDWLGFVSTPGAEAKTVDNSGLGTHFLDEVKATGAVL